MKKCICISLVLLTVLIFTACTRGEMHQTSPVQPQDTETAATMITEPAHTAQKRAITENYWGVWYLSGYNDVTLTVSEIRWSGKGEYAMAMDFSEYAPKKTFYIPYKSWDSVLISCGVTLDQD